jgi:tripartite-type tricarboxylate transporter receptor subunit TctC
VSVVNRVGAGGNIARSYVWKSQPDGYNLMITQQPSMSTGQIISGGHFEALGFTPIYNIGGRGYMGLAVRFDAPYNNLPELMEAAKKKEMTICGSGVGAIGWLTHLFLNQLGTKFRHVPYDSAAETTMAVAGGQVDVGCTNYSAFLPMVAEKKLKLVATVGPDRAEYAPDILTAREQGVDVSINHLCGVYGPPGMPKGIVGALAAGFEKATKDPEFLKRAKEAKYSLNLMGPEQFRKANEEIEAMIQTVKPMILQVKEQIKEK